jgi:hypothetical protein
MFDVQNGIGFLHATYDDISMVLSDYLVLHYAASKLALYSVRMQEARLAIEYIVIPGGEPVELLPRCSEIVARQLELVESYQLLAETFGTDSNSRLQILPVKITKKSSNKDNQRSKPTKQAGSDLIVSENGGGSSFSRLPLLPN